MNFLIRNYTTHIGQPILKHVNFNNAISAEIAFGLKNAKTNNEKKEVILNCVHLDVLKNLEEFDKLNGIRFTFGEQSQLNNTQLKIKFSVALRKFFNEKLKHQTKVVSNFDLQLAEDPKQKIHFSAFSTSYHLAFSLPFADSAIYLMNMQEVLHNFSSEEIVRLKRPISILEDYDSMNTVYARFCQLTEPLRITDSDLFIINSANTVFQPKNF